MGIVRIAMSVTGDSMDNSIYRKKAMDKISSPEQLDDFIQVARPKIWLIMGAIIILTVGAAVWAVFGVVEVTEKDGETRTVHPIEFVVN